MQVLTANRLSDGAVVYWAGAGAWSREIEQALVLDAAQAAAAMAQALDDDRMVVAPYFVALAGVATPAARVRTRETLRAHGPSIRVDYRTPEREGVRLLGADYVPV
jgi:hypothetical protein